jgi:hypothetical protein
MRKLVSLLLAATFMILGAAGLPPSYAEGPGGARSVSGDQSSSCSDRYNALLIQAKESLLRGDRNRAINSLSAAKIQLRHCEELEERNPTGAVAVALYSPLSVCAE